MTQPHTNHLFELLLEHSKDHAFICMDAQGVIQAWLGGAEEIFGYTADEVTGANLSTIFAPEDRARNLPDYELAVARADSRSEDERWHLRKDGTRIWCTGTVNALRDANGVILGFVKVVRDRTDLRSHIESLENQVATLGAARDHTHLFLKTLGHELRNPLAPLASATHIISKLNQDPTVERAVQIISRQAGVIARLADDMMDVSRLEEGKLELRLQTLDFRSLLNDAVTSLSGQASARGVRLEALLTDAPLQLQGDPERLQQVILNLIGNAIKFTPPEGRIWVKASQEGPDVVCRVEDTGVGIAPEMLPRIFDLFTQERRSRDVAPSGLGIGPALVREFVELHRGSVCRRSAGEGKGSEFTVRLPAPSCGAQDS